MSYNWIPSEWHLKLAEKIAPMAVYGIFRHAMKDDQGIWFTDRELWQKAKNFTEEIHKIFGPIGLYAPEAMRGPAIYSGDTMMPLSAAAVKRYSERGAYERRGL